MPFPSLAEELPILKILHTQSSVKNVPQISYAPLESADLYAKLVGPGELTDFLAAITAASSQHEFKTLYSQQLDSTRKYIETNSIDMQAFANDAYPEKNLLAILQKLVQDVITLLLFKNNLAELTSFIKLKNYLVANPGENAWEQVCHGYIALAHYLYYSSSLDIHTAQKMLEMLFKFLDLKYSYDNESVLFQDHLLHAWKAGASHRQRNQEVFTPQGQRPVTITLLEVNAMLVPLAAADMVGAVNPTDWAEYYKVNQKLGNSQDIPHIMEKIRDLTQKISKLSMPFPADAINAGFVKGITVNSWCKQLAEFIIELLLAHQDRFATSNFALIQETYLLPAVRENHDLFPVPTALGVLALIYHVYHSSIPVNEKTIILETLKFIVHTKVVDKQANANGKLMLKDVFNSLSTRGSAWIANLDGRIFNDADRDFFSTPGPTLDLLAEATRPGKVNLSESARAPVPSLPKAAVLEESRVGEEGPDGNREPGSPSSITNVYEQPIDVTEPNQSRGEQPDDANFVVLDSSLPGTVVVDADNRHRSQSSSSIWSNLSLAASFLKTVIKIPHIISDNGSARLQELGQLRLQMEDIDPEEPGFGIPQLDVTANPPKPAPKGTSPDN